MQKVTTKTTLVVFHDDMSPAEVIKRLSDAGIYVSELRMESMPQTVGASSRTVAPCPDNVIWNVKE